MRVTRVGEIGNQHETRENRDQKEGARDRDSKQLETKNSHGTPTATLVCFGAVPVHKRKNYDVKFGAG